MPTSSTRVWTIYADDLVELEWFKARSKLFKDATTAIIDRERNPDLINTLLRYDRPDIILAKDGKPVLVVEKTREVPTGHNVGQRFGRIVNAAEERVPVILFIPFKAEKHGKHQSLCNIPIRLFTALNKMEEIHKVPILVLNWPVDSKNEILIDGTENEEFDEILYELLTSKNNTFSKSTLSAIKEKNEQVVSTLNLRTDSLPNSARIVSTKEYIEQLRQDEKISDETLTVQNEFRELDKTLVYTIEMTAEKCNRQDPYTGQQFVYDYQFCRTGISPDDKKINLVLKFPHISMKTWLKNNPYTTKTKDMLWYVTASMMEFSDKIFFRSEWMNYDQYSDIETISISD